MVKLAIWPIALTVAAMGSLAQAAPPTGHDAGVAPPHPPGVTMNEGRKPIRERFPDLDAYLAYLQKRSHLDGAWYREIRPGVYELQTGNLRLPDRDAKKPTFTREQLERKFGFLR